MRNLTTHYDELGTRCLNCGLALRNFSADICNFLAESDELADWLDQVEQEFARMERMPLDTDTLVALSEEFSVSWMTSCCVLVVLGFTNVFISLV